MKTGVLLDIAGVLYEGDHAVAGAVDALERLRAAGHPMRFLTNSTRRSKRLIVQKLRSMGFTLEASDVLSPAEAACDWLAREGYAPHLLVHPDLEEDFSHLATSDRIAVVVGDAGRYFNYERLNAAFRALARGAPFLALAANRVFKDADGELSLDAGAFVRALEYSSGVAPIILGKPAPEFFLAGARSMGCAPGDVAMIGDDAESDVAGAIDAGIGKGILVRTGKYRSGDEDRFRPSPTEVVPHISAAADLLVGGRG